MQPVCSRPEEKPWRLPRRAQRPKTPCQKSVSPGAPPEALEKRLTKRGQQRQIQNGLRRLLRPLIDVSPAVLRRRRLRLHCRKARRPPKPRPACLLHHLHRRSARTSCVRRLEDWNSWWRACVRKDARPIRQRRPIGPGFLSWRRRSRDGSKRQHHRQHNIRSSRPGWKSLLAAGEKAARSIREMQFRPGLPFRSRNRSTKKPRQRLKTSMSISAATEAVSTARVGDKLHQPSRLVRPLASRCATTSKQRLPGSIESSRKREEDPAAWLQCSPDQLVLRHCAYWLSLAGAPATDNEWSVTVQVPRANLFTVEGLGGLMHRINEGGVP